MTTHTPNQLADHPQLNIPQTLHESFHLYDEIIRKKTTSPLNGTEDLNGAVTNHHCNYLSTETQTFNSAFHISMNQTQTETQTYFTYPPQPCTEQASIHDLSRNPVCPQMSPADVQRLILRNEYLVQQVAALEASQCADQMIVKAMEDRLRNVYCDDTFLDSIAVSREPVEDRRGLEFLNEELLQSL